MRSRHGSGASSSRSRHPQSGFSLPPDAANSDEFLAVAAGLIHCASATVRRGITVPEGASDAEQKEAAKSLEWIIEYLLLEHATHRWDEILVSAGDGKAKRRLIDLIPLMDFADFFSRK